MKSSNNKESLRVIELAGRLRFVLIELLDQRPERLAVLREVCETVVDDLLRHYRPPGNGLKPGAGGER